MAATASGQDDDEQPPGLLARFQVGSVFVERVDSDVAFQWGSQPPDERLPGGPFTATWNGTLLLRDSEKYQFHAFAQGRVSVKVDGKLVLDGTSDEPAWISGPETELGFGDRPIEIAFARTGHAAQLKLHWSSDEFPVEPVPYHSLFQTGPTLNLSLIEKGRLQFDAFRCRNCHSGIKDRPGDDERLDAPSLTHAGAGTQQDWLIAKLMQGSGDVPASAKLDGKMPQFGFKRDEAIAVLAALQSSAKPVEWIAAPKLKDVEREKDLLAGRTLIRSVGCLACHTWNSLGESTHYGGGPLDHAADRRSGEWLTTWLADPNRVNSRHRMPLVKLSDKERSQIVLALRELSSQSATPDSPTPIDRSLASHGWKLIEQARCSACHELPGKPAEFRSVISLTDPKVSWDRGCPLPPERLKNRPGFSQVDAQALRAYVASWPAGSDIRPFAAEASDSRAGRTQLERQNCLGCHDRDGNRGLSRHAAAVAAADESLSGLPMTLIPPRLNAVGDRMTDAGLAQAIRGEQKSLRLNWLRVRMPRFAHQPAVQSALERHLIGHDRIPDGGPADSLVPAGLARTDDSQRTLAGRELLGGKGFSCVACHAVKDYTPKVTALGTRGSNLYLIGDRMRPPYFFRWTRSPLRVMPGVEMPNYQKPHEFILPGQLDDQLAAIWQALNDPGLTAPTNPAVVEQLLAVNQDSRPRVVRDVFTVPAREETVARAFALGLPGGHSLLLDLETATVCAWTIGDFARQRCEGKRWYWDLAGTVLASGFPRVPEIYVVDVRTGERISVNEGWTVGCQLKRYDIHDDNLSLEYELTYSRQETTHRISRVVDTFRKSATGIERQISMVLQPGLWPWFQNAKPELQHRQARITIERPVVSSEPAAIGGAAVRFSAGAEPTAATLTIQYASTLTWANPPQNQAAPLHSRPDSITSVPGFRGERLALPRSIMPTGLAWDSRGNLLVTSLKGHLYRVDPLKPAEPTTVEEGLAAPYGLIEDVRTSASQQWPDLLVCHKPEVLRLELDDEGRTIHRRVLATGWGLTDDYHDWTCGIARDTHGSLYLSLGSDYTFKNRPMDRSRWRGHVLRVDPSGHVESMARGLRYPTGLAIDDQDRLFVSDQQGVQNTFNELDYIQAGHRYGVPGRHEESPQAPADPAAVQIPHPWTRSVNGIAWIPRQDPGGLAPWAGQFVGCEMNNNLLVRISVQSVGDVVQGAVYPFSKLARPGDSSNFVGPLCIGISPTRELFIGGLQDGGWAGGLNVGDIVKLTPDGPVPNGIREIRATSQGFDIDYFGAVDPQRGIQPDLYRISGYTRIWKGDYATPDSGHHSCEVKSVTLSNNRRTASLIISGRRTGHVYDVSVGDIGEEPQRQLWPPIGHFTLHRIPD